MMPNLYHIPLMGQGGLGFSWSDPLNSTEMNSPSSQEHGDAIDEYIQKELRAGNQVGPISFLILTNGQPLHANWIGVLPKGHNTSKWQVITDLSFRRGGSVNDGINAQWWQRWMSNRPIDWCQ